MEWQIWVVWEKGGGSKIQPPPRSPGLIYVAGVQYKQVGGGIMLGFNVYVHVHTYNTHGLDLVKKETAPPPSIPDNQDRDSYVCVCNLGASLKKKERKEGRKKHHHHHQSNSINPCPPSPRYHRNEPGHISLLGPFHLPPRSPLIEPAALFRLWRGKIMHFEIIHHIFDFLNLKSITQNTHIHTLDVSLNWYVIFEDFFLFFSLSCHHAFKSTRKQGKKKKKKKKKEMWAIGGYWHCTWCCRCAFLRSRSLGWESGSRREYLWRIEIFWSGGRSHQMWQSWRLVLSKHTKWGPISSAPHVGVEEVHRYRMKGLKGFGWGQRGGGVWLDVQVPRQAWLEPGGIPRWLYGKRRLFLDWLGLFFFFFF